MKKFLMHLFLIFLVVITFTACGGNGGDSGGGSAGDGSGTGGTAYTGSTSQTLITTSNAKDVTDSAYQSGGGTWLNSGLAVNAASADGRDGKPRLTIAVMAVERSLREWSVHQKASPSKALYPISYVSVGTCISNPGNAAVIMTFNDVNGSFTGTTSFNNYCYDGATLTGREYL
ncbi:MAG: hypothetical protein HY886_02325 [Deltaproteobacteria bacterium]|nr:hypothetical protein [Deltaproteobacteria bacterium]